MENRKSREKKYLSAEDRIRKWGGWGLMVLGLLIIVGFFNWWAKRGEQTYSVTPGMTSPASRATSAGSVSTEFIKPDVREAVTQPELLDADVIIGLRDGQQVAAIPELTRDDPTSQIGQVVQVKGQVEKLISPNIFRLDLATDYARDSILIVYHIEDLTGIAPAEGQTALVKGTVTLLHQEGLEELIGPLYLEDEIKAMDFEGQLALIVRFR